MTPRHCKQDTKRLPPYHGDGLNCPTHHTSDVTHHTSDIRHHTSHSRHQTSHIRHQTSHITQQTSAVSDRASWTPAGGHLEVLQWARANGVRWRSNITHRAAHGVRSEVVLGTSVRLPVLLYYVHLGTLEWMLAHGCRLVQRRQL